MRGDVCLQTLRWTAYKTFPSTTIPIPNDAWSSVRVAFTLARQRNFRYLPAAKNNDQQRPPCGRSAASETWRNGILLVCSCISLRSVVASLGKFPRLPLLSPFHPEALRCFSMQATRRLTLRLLLSLWASCASVRSPWRRPQAQVSSLLQAGLDSQAKQSRSSCSRWVPSWYL